MAIYTEKHTYPLLDILTSCDIYPAVGVKTEKDLPIPFHTDNALWDTGAEVTLINPRVVNKLDLKPIDTTTLDGIGGSVDASDYLIHIKLPTGNFALSVQATSSEQIGDHDIVIGMDIIALGDFLFTNKDLQSWFSFGFPAEEHIELKK